MNQNDPLHANQLIQSLPAEERDHLISGCEHVDLAFAQILAEPGERLRHIYFPTGGFVSLIASAGPKSTLEVALVGFEGMFSTASVLGATASPLRAIVQGAGSTLRIAAVPFATHVRESAPLRERLHRYVAVTLSQFAQAAACTRFHLLEERLARWLMMTRDRALSDEFHLTHDFLSSMLGVRRVGVTTAATALQGRGLIRYARGDISILDPAGLEEAACQCYRADLASYRALL